MPYTPPTHRSPSSSAVSSGEVSRRSSFNASKPSPVFHASSASLQHPTLPRSSSYLKRHRRAPSVSAPVTTLQAASEDIRGLVSISSEGYDAATSSKSLRQSPPPVTGDRCAIPAGAVISPPDSPSSSDDEDQLLEMRGRQLESTAELKQLQEAISQLPQPRRASSPNDNVKLSAADLGIVFDRSQSAANADGIRHSLSTTSLDDFIRIGSVSRTRGPSASGGRRVSHIRSATEPSILATPPGGSSLTASDEETDLLLQKPQMVRKKSGELVRPALRLGSRRRPSSMPGTPTFSKAVHFDSHLEHVRHFLQVDRPLAVSAGSSPVDNYDSESEYPFYNNERHKDSTDWDIVLTNFPVDTPARKAQTVRLERVWLSADQKTLYGSVSVLNLAFTKSVVCRFTLDYWKTTSEIAAEYSAEILPRTAPHGHDRFNFSIKLSDLANLESKTLYFCIRYKVDGKEFWDNNSGSNFQLDFKKKPSPANGQEGLQNSHNLPRSSRRQNVLSAPRPLSMPASLDDFDVSSKVVFEQSVQDYLGDSVPTLRLKSSESAVHLPSDNLAGRLAPPSGQAFANRYDFGASLSAAVQAAKDGMATKRDDGLYMKSARKFSEMSPPNADVTTKKTLQSTTETDLVVNAAQALSSQVAPPTTLRGILPTASSSYGSGSIASKSYDEIVSKYCFYVPKQPTSTKDVSSHIGQIDGSAGEVTQIQLSPPCSDGSPVEVSRLSQQQLFLQQSNSRAQWFTALSRDSSNSTIGISSNSGGSSPPATFTLSTRHDHLAPAIAFAQPQNRLDVQQQGQWPEAQGLRQDQQHTMHNSLRSSINGDSQSASPTSPASLVGAFSPFAGTPSEYTYQHMPDRFPFSNADAHSAAAIQG